ncbi:MAG: hypothetical protein J6B76_06915 [Peptococcaceae bacterium]|nr:hypothetical protein [Peptococcaceae bacterium]
MLFPSIMGAFGMVAAGYGSFEAVVLAAFGNATVWMMIFGMLAFAVMGSTKVTDVLIGKLLSLSIIKQNTNVLIYILLLVSAFMGAFGGGPVIALIFLLPVMENLFRNCGYEKGDKFIVFLLSGTILAAQIGMILKPWAPWKLMLMATATAGGGVQDIAFGPYFVMMLLVLAVYVLVYPIIMKLFRCDFSKLATGAQNLTVDSKNTKFNKAQIIALSAVMGFVILMLIISLIGSKIPFLNTINAKLGVLGLMAVIWMIFDQIKVDGKQILNIMDAGKSVNWDLTLLFAIAMVVSNQLTGADTGVSAFLASLLSPIFAGKSGLFIILFAAILTLVLTNVANNVAVAFLMINTMVALYQNGIVFDLVAASMLITMMSVIAIVTPAASVMGAMLHAAQSVTPGAVYKWSPVACVWSLIASIIVMIQFIAIFC